MQTQHSSLLQTTSSPLSLLIEERVEEALSRESMRSWREIAVKNMERFWQNLERFRKLSDVMMRIWLKEQNEFIEYQEFGECMLIYGHLKLLEPFRQVNGLTSPSLSELGTLASTFGAQFPSAHSLENGSYSSGRVVVAADEGLFMGVEMVKPGGSELKFSEVFLLLPWERVMGSGS